MTRFEHLSRLTEPYTSNDPWGSAWLNLPKSKVPTLVTEYIAEITTAPTNKYCTCEWIVHPDDVELPPGVKRRMRKGTTAWDCWIHTKEGLVLGFFTWIFAPKDVAPESESDLDAVMKLSPEAEANVAKLKGLISKDADYEEVMAHIQESAKPATVEQLKDWEEHPEKQRAVADALIKEFTGRTISAADKIGKPMHTSDCWQSGALCTKSGCTCWCHGHVTLA
jgi:hypothetical protein